MRRLTLAATLLLLGLCAPASALEIKNVRNCYAPPFLGATRPNLKILGGDVVFITYDIDALTVSAKTGKVSFISTLELIGPDGKQIFSKDTPNELIPQLGSTTIPGEINIDIPPAQKPGKYLIKMTVTDKEAKETKAFQYPFEVLEPAFGIVGFTAPAFGLVGTYQDTQFALVNMKLDDKKLCKVDLLMRVLDEGGKELSKIQASFPKDLPADVDLGKANFLFWRYPVYLNRTGRFTVEVSAKDTAGGGAVTLSYPFRVIDATSVIGK
ncbi:MAG: hypothetical protein U0793_02535 [Gemmataceae bacterium]